MAAGAWQVYGAAIEAIARNQIDLDTGTFAIVLATSAYTPQVDVDDAWSDISSNEVANGGGYATGGKQLTPVVHRTGSPAAGTVTFDCNDVSWTTSTITAKYAVIVAAPAPGSPQGADRVLCYSDLDTGGGSVSTTNGTFAINMHANGVFTIARA